MSEMQDGGLPVAAAELADHEAAMATGHEGRPTVAEQDRTHGAGLPEPDLGINDVAKYAC